MMHFRINHVEKNIILAILSVICLLCCSSPANAATEGDYTYTTNPFSTAPYGGAFITGYTGTGGYIHIPGTVGGYPVNGIFGSAFYGETSITDVIIPDSVKIVGFSAFDGCTGLDQINIPINVVSINRQAFSNCTSLGFISFDSPTTEIYDSALTISAQASIVGYPGSTAEAYAIKYGRNFVSEPNWLPAPPAPPYFSINGVPVWGEKKPIVKVNDEVRFEGLTSSSPDENWEEYWGAIVSYNWFFGDGNSNTGLTTPITSHTYNAPGEYTVRIVFSTSTGKTYGGAEKLIVSDSDLNLSSSSFDFGSMGEADTVKGPEISIGGKTFNLFSFPIGMEMPLGGQANIQNHILASNEVPDVWVKTTYDPSTQKYKVIIGDTLGEITTDPNDPYWKSQYKAIKGAVNLCGKSTDRDFYNAFRDVRKNLRANHVLLGIDCSCQTFGYMEFSTANGTPVFTEGGLVIVANADISSTYRFPPFPVAYVKVGIKGEASGKLVMEVVDAGQIDVYSQLGLNADLYGGLGLGHDQIANVEIGADGRLETRLNIPVQSLAESFSATCWAKAYFKWRFLLFADEKSISTPPYQIYPRLKSMTILSIDEGDLKMMPRDYLRGGRLTAQSLNELSLDQLSSTVIKSGVFPYGEPQLLPLGSGKQLLIWVDDKADRSLANRTALMYSVYDGGSWSSPAYVNDDGTADFAPRAIADNGQVYLTWQNANTTFADTVTLEEMAQGIDLSYAKFDGSSFTDITNLTAAADTTLEMTPIISAKGSEVTVAWIENSANDPFGLTGTYTIKTITSTGGIWGEIETLASDLPLITSLDAGYHNGAYILAYTTDMDGDISTNSDTELFLINTAPPTRITTDAIDDSGVQIVDQGAGSQIYWQSGDEIKSLSPDDNMVNTMSLTTPANQMRNLHILANDNSDQALVWEQSDGFKNELYGAYYNTAGSTWGGAIKLTALDGNIRQSSCYLDIDNNIQTAFDLAQVLEINETNPEPYGSTDLMVGSIGQDINLSIDGGVYYDQQLLQPDATINLNISVKNNSYDTVFQLEADILDQTDQILSTQSISTNITSGDSQEIEIPYTLPTAITKQDLKVQIRPIGVADVDMSDNQVTFTIGLADVALLSTEVLGGNTPNQIQVNIQNIGYDDALNIVATLQKDGFDGEVLDTQTIDSLAAGATQSLQFNLDPSWLEFASERDNKLFYVSLTTESPEGQYGNNASLVVVSPPHVTDVSLSPTTLELAVGSTAQLQATVNPSEALNQNILWWSENEAVATVDENGTVTGLKSGQTTIYAVSFDGNKMAGCAVNVTGLPGYTLSGQILVEGDDLTEGQPHYSGGVNIELKQGEEIKYSATSSEAQDLVSNGSFSLTGIAAGDYTVVISKAGYLTRSFALTINSDLTLSTTSNQYLNRMYILAGDIVSDEFNVIAASDVNYILSKFNSNSTQVGFDPQVDIVKDQYNVISAADVNLMLSNFNKNSTQYPADIVY